MKKDLKPHQNIGGEISVPGDKSIAHRAALFSILAEQPLRVKNYPDNADCNSSLEAAKAMGVTVEKSGNEMLLTPPNDLNLPEDTIIDCGNSGTTARLLSGIVAGSNVTVTLSGDESLSQRPMKRIIDPLSEMGAEFFSENGCLPLKITGKKLLPFEYRLPVASAQVKSSILLAGVASSCSVNIYEDTITRDHTEVMLSEIGQGLKVNEVKPVLVQDENDPRKKKMVMPHDYKKEIALSSPAKIVGGEIDIPGDISTAAFFMAAAAISGKELTIKNIGLNPTRTAFISHLKQIGCKVEITNKVTISGEIRGDVKVIGGKLKARKISGDTTVGLIDEIPIISVMAAFAEGTTIIRDAAELKVKESDRLAAVGENLELMGVKVGVLDDGLAIEGFAGDLNGSDFKSFGDHRIAMAFSIASLFLVGPSSIDDASVVDISCPQFYQLLEQITL